MNSTLCEFWTQKCTINISTLHNRGSRPLPEKAEVITNYKLPDTIHKLRTFLGNVNFYRRYLKDAAKTQAPLHDLLKGAKKKDNRKVPWTENTVKNFEQCKSELAKAALLSFPKSGVPLSLCCDASDFAIGSVLQQTDVSTSPSTTGLGAHCDSPSRKSFGDDYIVEHSDVFREAIKARNVYAAWARKLTQAKPSDPDLQNFHLQVGKPGEIANNLLIKLQVPLFKIPANEKELDKIILRAKTQVVEPAAAAKNHEENSLPAAPSSPPPFPRSAKKKREKRRADEQGFIPPRQLVRKKRTTSALPSTSTSPSGEKEVIESAPSPSTSNAPAADGEGMEITSDDPPAGDMIKDAPVPERKVRAPPPFFINPKGDWRQLVAIAKMHAPSFQSQMAGRFLKVTVADAEQYRELNSFLIEAGVEFKSFNMKEDRPVKVVIRGLPSNTEPEDILAEIEAECFK
ncbi:retrovirus-related Pol polyprotein from transposon opus, partial [Trichonephila clavata]